MIYLDQQKVINTLRSYIRSKYNHITFFQLDFLFRLFSHYQHCSKSKFVLIFRTSYSLCSTLWYVCSIIPFSTKVVCVLAQKCASSIPHLFFNLFGQVHERTSNVSLYFNKICSMFMCYTHRNFHQKNVTIYVYKLEF